MIKFLLLLISAWAVLCDQCQYSDPIYIPTVWSKGMTDEDAPEYHINFKNCLDRRSNSTKVPYKGANCILPGINEFNEDDIKEFYGKLTGRQDYLWGGAERRGNPGPQPPAQFPFTRPQYDKDLAEDAWRWARECLPGRDPCTLLNNTVGQTTFTVWSSWSEQINLDTILDKWYYEAEHVDNKLVDNFNPDPETLQKIGNYSQLFWSKTQKFGCAKRIDSNGTMYSTTVVCNFWPQGNIIGEPIYRANWTGLHV